MQCTQSPPGAPIRHDQLVRCPECGGAGEFVEPNPGFNMRTECWEPHYEEIICGRCEGHGYLGLDDVRRRQAFQLGEPRR